MLKGQKLWDQKYFWDLNNFKVQTIFFDPPKILDPNKCFWSKCFKLR